MTDRPPNAPAPIRLALAAAAERLARNAAAVDSLNVYPVPDGDTGSNMHHTMQAGLAAANACPDQHAGAVADAMARGALMGARGNSGVILSQIWRGVAEGLRGKAELSAGDLAAGFGLAAERAYRAVGTPVEGTILTVARAAAEGAALAAKAPGATTETVLAAATAAAQQALARTPEQLPVLKQAGVVDAGGQGLVLLLEGALAGLQGHELADAGSLGEIDRDWLRASAQPAANDHEAWGYCTQFVIANPAATLDKVRQALTVGDAASVLVVGDEQALHIHLHTFDPGAALSRGVALGTLHNIKVDNMADQNAALVAAKVGTAASDDPAPPAGLALPVVAVVAGEGMRQVFTSLGASRIVAGGQSMNPSVQQLADAADAIPGDTVVVLPNNPNVLLVCQHLHEVTGKRVLVVPSHTMAQGIAALLAVDLNDGVDDQAAAMQAGLSAVTSIEVTTATRSVTLDGMDIWEGQTIGLVDRKLVAAGADPLDVLGQVLDRLAAPAGSLLTLYYGDGVTEADAEATAAALRTRPHPPEVDVVWGGQPHYSYLASLEV